MTHLPSGARFPDFLIVGAAKSGTTSLYDWLGQHPEIGLAAYKETDYFSGLSERVTQLDRYLLLFPRGQHSVLGEASVSYMPFHEVAIPRITKEAGSPKIIICLRQPVERAFSHYQYYVQLRLEREPAIRALSFDHRPHSDPWGSRFNPYLVGSSYKTQVGHYNDAFPEVLLVVMEEFKAPLDLCRRVFQFVGVDPSFEPECSPRNITGLPRTRFLSRLLAIRWIRQRLSPLLPPTLRSVVRGRLTKRQEIGEAERRILEGVLAEEAVFYSSLKAKIISAHRDKSS
jgi:hypothetical protein